MFEYYFKYRGVHFHDTSAESGKQDFETWPCWEVRETSGDKLVGILWEDRKNHYRFAVQGEGFSSFSCNAKTQDEAEEMTIKYIKKKTSPA